jgi:hypothetical protein
MCLLCAGSAHAYIGGENPPSDLHSVLKIRSCTFIKVAEHFLLSAAHCSDNFHIASKVVDLLDTQGAVLEGHHMKTEFSEPIIHPEYQAPDAGPTSDYNDLMLVRVQDASLFTSTKISTRPITDDDELIVGGFGEKGEGYPRNSEYTCAKKKIIGGDDRHIIIGIENSDGKGLSMGGHGDSGAPVYRVNSKNEYELVGIIGARSISSNLIKVDPVTGKIVDYDKTQSPILWINRISDSLPWLRSILPAESFAN